jgi:hopene-associated glycosyltransferase HpnB
MIGAWLAWIALAAWVWLLTMRGRFWAIDPPQAAPEPAQWPSVVAVIPARDEAPTIATTVASLRAHDYPGPLAIIVVDDQSTDGTGDLARAAGAELVSGSARPEGWVGKVWAMAQGLEAASRAHPEAELVLFTDADIGHAPGELRATVARLVADRLDLASLMVRLNATSLSERAIVPAFVYFFRLLYPFAWVADPIHRTAAAAGGYMLVRRGALDGIGGMSAIKNALIDDCALAGAIKARGGRIRLELASDTVSLRAYDWEQLWRMIARSAYTQLQHSPALLVGTVLGTLLGFVAAPVIALHGGPGAVVALLAWALMALSYLPMLSFYRLSPLWAPLLPLVALFYLGATIDSARRHRLGRGGEWKGRVQAP